MEALNKNYWKDFELVPLKELKPDKQFYHFQQYSIYKSLEQPRFINGTHTGLGKTAMSLASFFYYRTKYPQTKLLIITKKSAVIQFPKEINKFFNTDLKWISVHPSMESLGAKTFKQRRLNAISLFGDLESPFKIDILVITYTMLRLEFKAIRTALYNIRRSEGHLFTIYDEATAFKNMKTATWRVINETSRLSNRVTSLTATLTKGKLEDVYNICKGMGIQLTSNKETFYSLFCEFWVHPSRPFIKNITGYKNLAMFNTLIEPISVIFRKSDVSEELPPFTIDKILIPHSKEQIKTINKIYKGEISLSSIIDESKEDSFVKGIVEINAIKFTLLDDRILNAPEHLTSDIKSPKTEAILDMLKDEFTDEKVVIYTPSKKYLHLLADTIESDKDIPEQYKKVIRYHGDVSAGNREKVKDLFSESLDHNLIIMTDAGLESINLQAANTMIITTMTSTFGNLVQLTGRISRLGSTHKNLYLRFLLTEGSQDEDEFKIIMQQGLLFENVLGESEKGLLDIEYLKLNEKDQDITEEEFRKKSMSSILFKKRSKKALYYKRLASNLTEDY